MKSWKTFNLLGLSFLVACSTNPKVAQETQYYQPHRTIAELDVTRSHLSVSNVKKTIKGIFHSYIEGQVLLEKFDKALDKDPATAMQSEAYSELQAIRSLVDGYEHQLNDMYVDLVMVSSLPKYDEIQRENARKSLQVIDSFIADGAISENEQLPENLQHLVVGNLRGKQDQIVDELKGISEDPSITQNDPEVQQEIQKSMVKLEASRTKLLKKAPSLVVDKKLLKQTIAKQQKDKDYMGFKSRVKEMSKEFKAWSKEVSKGRSTSSDTIYPSASSAGNITGRGFPANTWAITYDDGPGAKTSPVVLKNLQDRNMKATFFMLAKQVENLPSTAKSIADAGMDLASHSYDHAQLTKLGNAALDKQISGSKKIIETKLGKEIKFFRLPYGAGVSNTNIRNKIADAKMIHVFWNVDTLDWQDKNPTSILNRTLKQMAANNNRGVILFHDIHQQTVTASKMLMDHMIKNKIKACTLQGIVDQINKGLSECQ